MNVSGERDHRTSARDLTESGSPSYPPITKVRRARIRRHVLLDELRELFRGPRLSFGIENHDAIGLAERRENLLGLCPHPTLRSLTSSNFQRQKCPIREISPRKASPSGDLRLPDPQNPQLHLFEAVLLPLFEQSLAADAEDLCGLDFFPCVCRSTSKLVPFDVFERRHLR